MQSAAMLREVLVLSFCGKMRLVYLMIKNVSHFILAI